MSGPKASRRTLLNLVLGEFCLALLFACSAPAGGEAVTPVDSSGRKERAKLRRPTVASRTPAKTSQPTDVTRSGLRVGDQELSLHLPEGLDAPLPTVLVLHSSMGRTESVLGWCDRLAQGGFAAVALDFFDGEVANSPDEGKALRDKANARSAQVQARIESAYEAVHQDARLRAEKRFLLGWSYGAAWSTYSLIFLKDVSGVVAYYGQAFTDNPALFDSLSSPVLLIGGRLDSAPPPERLESVVTQLKSNGKDVQLQFLEAGHGFAEQANEAYDQAASVQAWSYTIGFLQSCAGEGG